MERGAPKPTRTHRRKKRQPAYGERKTLDEIPQIPYLTFGDVIGNGHFSHVYSGVYYGSTPVAIKVIERGSESLIASEIDLLNNLRECECIIQLLEVIRGPNTILVFEFISSISSERMFHRITLPRVRKVIKSLLTAVACAHSKNIVHRDIKLGNILITPHFTEVKLIDWGCGTFVSDQMSPKAGSRTCRSPEMLLGYRNYGTACDTWAIGVFIMFILCGGVVPWKARESTKVLALMSTFFGGDNILEYADRLGIEVDSYLISEMSRKPTRTLESAFNPEYTDIQDPMLIDLMEGLMEIDLTKRLTAEAALHHPFFSE